jgi:hypothetical protein
MFINYNFNRILSPGNIAQIIPNLYTSAILSQVQNQKVIFERFEKALVKIIEPEYHYAILVSIHSLLNIAIMNQNQESSEFCIKMTASLLSNDKFPSYLKQFALANYLPILSTLTYKFPSTLQLKRNLETKAQTLSNPKLFKNSKQNLLYLKNVLKTWKSSGLLKVQELEKDWEFIQFQGFNLDLILNTFQLTNFNEFLSGLLEV